MSEQMQALLEEFFSLDDLQNLTSDAGALLGCPILVVDDAFHVSSQFAPLGFADPLFRTAVASGEISYENAVYLWEKDSTEVIAVRADSYQTVQDNIVSFTDDGNVTHTCYILDTKID